MGVQGLANFLDDLMGGLQLIGLGIVIGSLSWGLVVLRKPGAGAAALQRCLWLLRSGALGLAIAQALKLLTKAAVIASSLGELPFAAYANTVQFRAGAVRIVLATALVLAARRLSPRADSRTGWAVVVALTLALIVSGAWLVHAVGRFDQRWLLMALTVVHQLAAGIWVGGVVQLLSLWHLSRTDAGASAFWPIAVTRFSALGIAAVGGLLSTGLVLALYYIGSWQGLLGTAYGSLVLAKVFLLAVTLGFAYLNFSAGRSWLRDPKASAIRARVPQHVEAETFLLISLLFLAATVSSQPPAVDIPKLTASVQEVAAMFAPKVPRITSPGHQEMLAGEAGRSAVIGQVPSIAGLEWSDYNHNISGIFLLSMSLIAFLSYRRRFEWAKYWPLGFVALSVFLFFRSDAETWPLGPVGFWESTLRDGEVLQHRTATLLAFTLGALETRARVGNRDLGRLRFLFPLLCAFGGILLITHSHTAFEIKSDYLIQSTHLAMGLLAALMATGRWLELRWSGSAPGEAKLAGLLSITAMLFIGVILLFYKEGIAS